MEIKALRDNINLLGRSTTEDAEAALERSGLTADDFEFKVSDQTDYSGAFYNTRSTVEVSGLGVANRIKYIRKHPKHIQASR